MNPEEFIRGQSYRNNFEMAQVMGLSERAIIGFRSGEKPIRKWHAKHVEHIMLLDRILGMQKKEREQYLSILRKEGI